MLKKQTFLESLLMPFLSENFQLGALDENFDFLDIDLDKDTKKFVDPYAMSQSSNKHMQEGHKNLKIFMQETITALMNYSNSPQTLNGLWIHEAFREPKGTGIGLSKEGFKGKGSGSVKCKQITTALRNSEAATTGCLEDLEELILVVEGVGADTISDMTINMSKKYFMEYTLEKCQQFSIPTKKTNEKIMHFCPNEKKWKKDFFELPHALIGVDKIESYLIFIPEEILEKNMAYGCNYFYTNIASPDFVEMLMTHPSTSFIVSLKNGTKKVSLTDMRKDARYQGGKNKMDKYISQNPGSLKKYRKKVANHRYKYNQAQKQKPKKADDDQS